MATGLMESENFKIENRVLDPKKDNYRVFELRKDLDLSEKAYSDIIKGMGGLVSEKRVKAGVAINFVAGVKDGRPFAGVLIGEEGHYQGIRPNVHISKNDENATHVILHFGVPTKSKELMEELSEIARKKSVNLQA